MCLNIVDAGDWLLATCSGYRLSCLAHVSLGARACNCKSCINSSHPLPIEARPTSGLNPDVDKLCRATYYSKRPQPFFFLISADGGEGDESKHKSSYYDKSSRNYGLRHRYVIMTIGTVRSCGANQLVNSRMHDHFRVLLYLI